MRLLLDADAFLCARRLSFLDLLTETLAEPLILTEYIARHELSTIAATVAGLQSVGKLRVEAVRAGTPAYNLLRALRRRGVHKGESEAIAWASGVSSGQGPCFVSLDAGARSAAQAEGVESVDLLDAAVLCVREGLATKDEVRRRLEVWEDRRQQFGRPPDFTTFEATFALREGRIAQRRR